MWETTREEVLQLGINPEQLLKFLQVLGFRERGRGGEQSQNAYG
jgi:hypothetical protein